MKGIILAGGSGSRLFPCTKVTCKQLLPIYNKPMIYYPLETLLKAGIREILIIVAPEHAGDFVNLLGSGKDFGAKFLYEVQDKPEGLAHAFLIGESFIDEPVTMILGDNIFENDLKKDVQSFSSGARVFIKEVEDAKRFGVVEFDEQGEISRIIEKPESTRSRYAVTGLYIYDETVVQKTRILKPSRRGELEITDLNNLYLKENKLDYALVKGEWIDMGTFESMVAATLFIRERELLKTGEASDNGLLKRILIADKTSR